MTQYLVTAHSFHRPRTGSSGTDYSVCREHPSFILDSTIQGIVSAEHAERIAVRMLIDCGADSAIATAVVFESLHPSTIPANADSEV